MAKAELFEDDLSTYKVGTWAGFIILAVSRNISVFISCLRIFHVRYFCVIILLLELYLSCLNGFLEILAIDRSELFWLCQHDFFSFAKNESKALWSCCVCIFCCWSGMCYKSK